MKKTLISVVLLSLVLLASQAAGAQTMGLRADLFNSGSATLDTILVPGTSGSIIGIGEVNFKPNADLYITLKGAIEKGFTFTTPVEFSGMIDATYLMNDKFALNFRLNDIGEISAKAEYIIVNNNKFDLAAQLGVGYGKSSMFFEKLFVGADLFASYDILSNLNLSASVGLAYDFNDSDLFIVDEIKVNYVPIKYVDLTLAYERVDAIGLNGGTNHNYDTLQFIAGTGINEEYFNTVNDLYHTSEFEINSYAALNNGLGSSQNMFIKGYDYILNPNSFYNSLALTNKLALNYNVDLKLFGLLDGNNTLGNTFYPSDMLDITAGLTFDITNNFDLSFFVGAYLSKMFDGVDGVDADMLLSLGLGYDVNKSLKAGLTVSAYLEDLTNLEPNLFVNPSVTYAVNNNLNVKLSYIGTTNFNNPFNSLFGIGAEIKF